MSLQALSNQAKQPSSLSQVDKRQLAGTLAPAGHNNTWKPSSGSSNSSPPTHYPPFSPTYSGICSGPWRKTYRILLTVFMYAAITCMYRSGHVQTVLYTCGAGQQHSLPRAVNTRWDTIFHTGKSGNTSSIDDYFCKVRTAKEMVQKHPGKRIVYVDEDMVIDLQAVIDEVRCTRLSFFVTPGEALNVQTPFFCFPADKHSLDMLETWWDVRESYPKHPYDQLAMNDLIDKRKVKVLTFDPTGLEVAHCSHGVHQERARCKDAMTRFLRYDRAIVLVYSFLYFVLWLVPLALLCGAPLPLPGCFHVLLDLNPLIILAGFGVPRILVPFLLRNNRLSGGLPLIYTKVFSGLFVFSVGDLRRLWVPMVGQFTLSPERHSDVAVAAAYFLLFFCMIIFRRSLDRWTCMTCPTLYHWVAWMKSLIDRYPNSRGFGQWLVVAPADKRGYHLSWEDKWRVGKAAVPADSVFYTGCGGSKQ